MFSTETVLLKATNGWPWNVDNNLLNGVIFLDIWIMLFYWESLNAMGSVLNLLPGSGPIYLTESNEPLLMELNLISVIYRVFQKFVPIVNCILRKAFNASLGKCKLIQVGNLSK